MCLYCGVGGFLSLEWGMETHLSRNILEGGVTEQVWQAALWIKITD